VKKEDNFLFHEMVQASDARMTEKVVNRL